MGAVFVHPPRLHSEFIRSAHSRPSAQRNDVVGFSAQTRARSRRVDRGSGTGLQQLRQLTGVGKLRLAPLPQCLTVAGPYGFPGVYRARSSQLRASLPPLSTAGSPLAPPTPTPAAAAPLSRPVDLRVALSPTRWTPPTPWRSGSHGRCR